MPTDRWGASVAIVDYGMGNLFSVMHACEYAGLAAKVTSSPAELMSSDAVILPGVGAFGVAMESLDRMGLAEALRETAAADKPLMGICLGAQLLMSESHEFGLHRGLGIIEGSVASLGAPSEDGRTLKVPLVGWNSIHAADADAGTPSRHWDDTLLRGLGEGELMYFVHSFVMRPSDPTLVVSTTRYGDVEFCSGYRQGSVHGFQFHPERSGPSGLRVYQNLASLLKGDLVFPQKRRSLRAAARG